MAPSRILHLLLGNADLIRPGLIQPRRARYMPRPGSRISITCVIDAMTHPWTLRKALNKSALSVLILLLGLAGCEQGKRLGQGDPAPPFELLDLTGERRVFPADFAGTPVVIRFWADWCRFCKKEMQDVEAVYQTYRDRGLAILAVNVGQSHDTARDFVEGIGISYDTLLDRQSEVAGAYGVVGLPTTFFVDRDGRVRLKILGEADKETFERMLVETL